MEERNTEEKQFLDGLKRYKALGVRIMIDGQERPEDTWDEIFSVRELPGEESQGEYSYMADFITAPYGRKILEIHLDKIHIRSI